MNKHVTTVAAAAGLLVVLAALAGVAAEGPAETADVGSVQGRATVWVKERGAVRCQIMLETGFRPTIAELVPEWTRVEKGQVVARLYSPSMEDERAQKVEKVRLAEAQALKEDAEAAAATARLESAWLEAAARAQEAADRLAAAEELPDPDERKQAELRLAESRARADYAAQQHTRMLGLADEGLCSRTELDASEHDCTKADADVRQLEARLAELTGREPELALKKARLALTKAELELELAGRRKTAEVERRRLLCRALRLEQVGPAQRALELTDRREAAMALAAPESGYVLYGYRWDVRGLEKISRGKPLYFGQEIASIINLENLRVGVEVPERDFLEVALGDRVDVELTAVPGTVYQGKVTEIRPRIWSDKDRFLKADPEAMDRYGSVTVELQEVDSRVRPGMSGEAKIHAAPSGVAAASAGDAAQPEGAISLRGWLQPKSTQFIRAPFSGRVVWAAEQGTQVAAGEALARLNPGLTEDWKAELADQLECLQCRLKAAEVQADLCKEVVEPVGATAQVDVELARVDLAEAGSRPIESARLAAENALAEAQWQHSMAVAGLDAFRELAAGGLASAVEVRQRELASVKAQAGVARAEAELREVLEGASEPELALARADLQLAEANMAKAKGLAEGEVAAAQAELDAARARLAAFSDRAARRRAKAERSEVTSPIGGIVLWGPQEGEEVREGWWLGLVAETDELEVHAVVDETDYSKIAAGDAARVWLTGRPNAALDGTVVAVTDWQLPMWYWSGTPEEKVKQGRLYECVIKLGNARVPPCIGMSCMVQVRPAGPGGSAATSSGADADVAAD